MEILTCKIEGLFEEVKLVTFGYLLGAGGSDRAMVPKKGRDERVRLASFQKTRLPTRSGFLTC